MRDKITGKKKIYRKIHKKGVAQSVNARPSELEGRHFDPRHFIDVCFDFPLFRVAVALRATSLFVTLVDFFVLTS